MTEFKEILKTIRNPTQGLYEIKINCPELTFIGVKEQPDFGELEVIYTPFETIIELKSLKFYIYQFRNKLYAYEALINYIYDDIVSVYNPRKIIVNMYLNPRGGITSKLTVDSEDK